MVTSSSADRRLAHLARVLADQYEFRSLLGEGGAGAVYEVQNRYLDRPEALKVLSESFLDEQASDRFTQEAQVAASLDHPAIVKVYDFGREEGIHWFSMQLVDGPALSDLVEAGLAFDARMLARLAIPILEALEFSHGRGVIHRDLKPANILFSLDGRPYLTDFGVAKTQESVLKTQTGHLLGTPAYVSPEQALGEPVDARTDQYSLGITLYKTLTGRLPFTADNVLQTLVLRLKEEPEPIEKYRPDLPPELAGILMRSLARDRTQRWDSIAVMQYALERFCDRAGIPREGPLEAVAQFPPVRLPLPDLQDLAESPLARPQGSFEPTADLPLSPRGGRMGWLAIGLALALLGGLWWSRRSAPSPAAAPPPTEALPTAASAPAPTSAPILGKPFKLPSPAPALVRRPVVYPQLVESGPIAAPSVACAGLRINVSLRVAEDGTVAACKVLTATRPDCAEAAKAVALRYRFKPALDAQGQPLETTIAAAVDFPEVP